MIETVFKHIDVAQCKTLMEQNTATTVLDIRDPKSYSDGHIEGAIPAKEAKTFIATADKTAPLIVCCYHGNTSKPAAQQLAKQGFTDVYSLDGGYEAWRQATQS